MWSFFSRDPSKDFPFDILEPVNGTENYMIWKLHKGKKKATGEAVSVFILDAKVGSSDTQLELAKAHVKRLKTLRHPNVLTFIDSLETDKCVYLVTESVEPLQFHLNSFATDDYKGKQQKELFIAWGLFQVTRALSFLNNDGNLQHNSVCLGSIFVNTAGEWKLAGLEYTVPANPLNTPPTKILPGLEKYDPPERVDSSKLKHATKWSVDMWGLGCLIWEVFNGSLKSPASLKSIGSIPKQLVSVYCELVGANPSSRPNPKDVVAKCRQSGGYFHNDLVESLLFLEEIQIKEANDKTAFFTKLPSLLDSFPDDLSKHKILPQLINAFEFGNAGSTVLAPLFKLGNLLSEDEYQKKIVPCVVKLFSSPDRATRARLLQQLEHFAGHLQASTVNDQIFPQIANGFLDANPTIREQTVRSIWFLAPKLNFNNLNVEVLRHLARLQAKDEEGGVRFNTTVCLGKLAPYLDPQTRQKVLVSAFTRALRDPFPHSRKAGILGLVATQQYYHLSQISQSVLPSLCPLTCDPDRDVRDHTFKAMKNFLLKLEKVSEDPSLKESMEAEINSSSAPVMMDVASTWAGWAVSAVTSKFQKSQPDKPLAVATTTPTAANNSAPSTAPTITSTNANSSSTTATASSAKAAVPTNKAPVYDKETVDSDKETNWDSNDWGDMDTLSSNAMTSSASKNKSADGWDVDEEDEEWAPFVDDDDDKAPAKNVNANKPAAAVSQTTTTTISNSDFIPVPDKSLPSVTSYQWDSATSTQTLKSNNRGGESAASWDNWASNGDGNWQSADGAATDKDDARKRRDEKRHQRQKEIEAKRNARQGGPLKLGAKKLAND